MSLKYIFIYLIIISITFSIVGCLKTKPKKKNIVFSEMDNKLDNNVYRRDQIAVQPPKYHNLPKQQYNNPYLNNRLEEENESNNNIHLQIQAVEDYRVAKRIKESLELKSGQFSYIKRGQLNKIVIGGIKSEEEANFLRDTQYPGSFIVYPENNQLENNYSTNVDDNSGYSENKESSYSGLVIQLGAFRDENTAHRVSNNYQGNYKTKIIKVIINSNTLYKVVVIGFETREEAEKEQINSNLTDSYITYI